MKTSLLALLILTSVGLACGGGSQSATAPATTSTSSGTFETYSGILGVQGSGFYSFTVASTGTVSITLASLTASSVGAASPAVVRLSLGVPVGTGCNVTNFVDTAAGLTTQLTTPVTPDVYCVNISDIGQLTGPLNFTIRIGQNVTPSSSTAVVTTETFASFLSIGGTSARTLTVSQSGTISVTLGSVTPTALIGMGIGIPVSASSICSLSNSLSATAGSQLTIAVDAGTYCVEMYDPGGLIAPGVSFSTTITHP
jgi:hypothetical protein